MEEIIYMDGRKYLIINSLFSEVEGITVIGETVGTEYPILENAPSPFVYGVKFICIKYNVTNKLCTLYDVRKGVYLEDQPFKGKDWVREIPSLVDTRPIPEETYRNIDNTGSHTEEAKTSKRKEVIELANLSEINNKKALKYIEISPSMLELVNYIEGLRGGKNV